MKNIFTILIVLPYFVISQNYTSYFVGNPIDMITNPSGGICLMGGATENDEAMIWFLEQANGGDVLILRASGSDGYNDYFYSSLGVNLNSVETIVCLNAAASQEDYLVQKIQKAEAIWFAGGNQWNYISYWRNSPIATAINEAIENRNIAIGGTSAGMAIMGQHYFSAQNGSVSSSEALLNPFNSFVTVDSTPFINNEILIETITDTHFDNPDRKGRLTTFLARMYSDYNIYGKAIACDEYTAVCIDNDGIASVFGGFPTYDDNAYFVQTNCELSNPSPENISPNIPLNWNHDGQALKVYRVKGTSQGNNSFDLNLWKTGNGGEWLHWSVNLGTFIETSGSPINCDNLSNQNSFKHKISIYPNPSQGIILLNANDFDLNIKAIKICNVYGQTLPFNIQCFSKNNYSLDLTHFPNGTYFVSYEEQIGLFQNKIIIAK